MLDLEQESQPQTLAQLHQLRMEAMRLFEECLTQGDEAAFVAFIERQIALGPQQTHLLREIADDLQLRLLSLKEHHFDVRERVITAISEGYGVDITALAPANQLEHYHELNGERLVAYIQNASDDLSEEDLLILHKLIAASLAMAAQLQGDIFLTQRLHQLVADWLGGMHSSAIRLQWPSTEQDTRAQRPLLL